MLFTKGAVWRLYKQHGPECRVTDTSRKLLGMDGSIGNFHSVRAKIGREMSKRPRDRGTAETKRNIEAWENEVLFRGEDTSDPKPIDDESSSPVVMGRPRATLSQTPHKKTVKSILQPKIDELMSFAAMQGIEYEEVLHLLEEPKPKKKKKAVFAAEIDIEDAVSFYFSQEHSSRSWTELRLFLSKYEVYLPARNQIDTEKKKILPPIKFSEIKSEVNYSDLVTDTVHGESYCSTAFVKLLVSWLTS